MGRSPTSSETRPRSRRNNVRGTRHDVLRPGLNTGYNRHENVRRASVLGGSGSVTACRARASSAASKGSVAVVFKVNGRSATNVTEPHELIFYKQGVCEGVGLDQAPCYANGPEGLIIKPQNLVGTQTPGFQNNRYYSLVDCQVVGGFSVSLPRKQLWGQPTMPHSMKVLSTRAHASSTLQQ